ncbi:MULTISPECIES: helix-turn-helix transcriptional regulator [unclassified Cryobacterium]|uniref:helix-turn-helix domain-containing protein n=1 Tax=unclassified Cryobacterium TaxID=2649013 RepID=UPI00106BD4B0|nr:MULTISPECIES: helix-turn-helix transcriptional regulator [unclassified Cryobacterium]TFC59467.1 XRE family transcriptional regulator [Cryobacterium sp. TMB3-1-2]TFC67263.1 XRE family transcriptional regulator [Cryobacterium sp. TMB3-15]TFC73224.1 XRE family transcriptional regulator [Cryobacterium sp. TMB3-10]TFD46112.1 XRE family transcriptional regulator [Cryobacterium sp. TMB3-12]
MEHTLRRAKIAEVVSAEIKRQGVTRKSLAKATRISADALRRRLSGERPFYVDELLDICKALDISVAVIFDRAGIK